MAYRITEKKESKPGKTLKTDRESYMVIKLKSDGILRVVHKNLGESLIAKGAATKADKPIEEANKAREKAREEAMEAQEAKTGKRS